jgi:hypothetical protein
MESIIPGKVMIVLGYFALRFGRGKPTVRPDGFASGDDMFPLEGLVSRHGSDLN